MELMTLQSKTTVKFTFTRVTPIAPFSHEDHHCHFHKRLHGSAAVDPARGLCLLHRLFCLSLLIILHRVAITLEGILQQTNHIQSQAMNPAWDMWLHERQVSTIAKHPYQASHS
jgi:hypothetical protein